MNAFVFEFVILYVCIIYQMFVTHLNPWVSLMRHNDSHLEFTTACRRAVRDSNCSLPTCSGSRCVFSANFPGHISHITNESARARGAWPAPEGRRYTPVANSTSQPALKLMINIIAVAVPEGFQPNPSAIANVCLPYGITMWWGI